MRSKTFRVLKCSVVALALAGLALTSARSNQGPGKVDFRRDVPSLEVPVYLVAGAHEARGRAVLAEEWFAPAPALAPLLKQIGVPA